MPATWPDSVRFFDRADNHTRTGRQGAVLRTPMATGPAKTRRRSTAAPRGYSGSIPWLDRWQFGTFEAFVSEVIADGALSFTAIDPADGLTKTFRFANSEPYVAEPAGLGWTVSAALEVLSGPARATVAQTASILGDPVAALVDQEMTGVPALYSGQPGTIGHRWIRIRDGEVLATTVSYTVQSRALDEVIAYRTIATNGPSSTSGHVSVNGWLFDVTEVVSIRPVIDAVPTFSGTTVVSL